MSLRQYLLLSSCYCHSVRSTAHRKYSQLLSDAAIRPHTYILCTHNVTINLRVGENLEQFLSTSGVKQGDNLAPILFIFVIHAVSYSLDKKWEFTTPDFRWYPDTQLGSKPRGQLRGTKHSNKGTMFSFFKSYYVDDTAFILLSRGEVVAASKLIVSHFRRFGLTIHTGSKRKNEK
jgi:hypothetical protein